MSKEKKKSWAVAILLQKQHKSGTTMSMMLSVHPGNEDEAIGYAIKSCKEDKPGFVIAEIITQSVF